MSLLGQNPKIRRHMAMLVIVLIILMPFTGFATLLLATAFFSGHPPEGLWHGAALVVILAIPAAMLITGAILLTSIRSGFTHVTRKRLLVFYVSLLAYCGLWTVAPFSRNGIPFVIFELPAVLTLTTFISIPAFVTLFTNPQTDD